MEPTTLTAALVVSVLAALAAIAFEIVAGLKEKWEPLSREKKRFAWLLGCLGVGMVPVGLACVGLTQFFTVSCSADGVAQSFQIATTAYFSGQFAHGITAVTRKSYASYVSRNQRWRV